MKPAIEIAPREGAGAMSWDVQFDEKFAAWLDGQDEAVADAILKMAGLLAEYGPGLGRPRVDTIVGSEFQNMKELRVQVGGDPWRILFAFDPKRSAILLVGGNKGGDKRWYKRHIPIADERFRRHLERLDRAEGDR